jgi:UDP-glucose 4-epimerase
MRALVTGAAGFIGSNLVDRLLSLGYFVKGVDNFSTGQHLFLKNANSNPNFKIFNVDLLNLEAIKECFIDTDIVFHLSANADVRFGLQHPSKDLQQNTLATFNVLEAMRFNNIKNIIFSSTGSVYGESKVIPTSETAPFPIQTSLYGASKVAGESLIAAYCEGFDFNAWIFRFVSILGDRYTHGHVFDFYKQLRLDSSNLLILGNGKQRKSYLHVQDCLDAILLALNHNSEKVNIYNLGLNDYCEVNNSVKWICDELGLNPELKYSGGERGWIGDNPFIFLDTKKIQSLGWTPKYSIHDGIISTIRFLKKNDWVFDLRS